MMTMTRNFLFAASLLMLGLGACSPEGPDDPTATPDPNDLPAVPTAEATGNEDTTFDHMQNEDAKDPFEILKDMQNEGPPAISSRLHSCPKMRYSTIGRVLASRGVNLGSNNNTAAGNMWTNSGSTLGTPNYATRARESRDVSTAFATKLFDIFVQAAPEIIANMPNQSECQISGQGVSLFTASGACNPDGITCLTGVPATVDHLTQCNLIVNAASTPEVGRVLAVATMLAAAHTCE